MGATFVNVPSNYRENSVLSIGYTVKGKTLFFLLVTLEYLICCATCASFVYFPSFCEHIVIFVIIEMARDKKFGKRKFYGNRFTVNKKQSDVNRSSIVNSSGSAIVEVENEVMSTPSTSGCVNVHMKTPPSASRRKLCFVNNDCKEFSENSENNGKISSGFHLVDIEQLSEALKNFVVCKYCKGKDCVSVFEDVNRRNGLAAKLILACSKCNKEHSFNTSKQNNNVDDINVRFVYGMRCIGGGLESGKTLCSILNIPNPPVKYHKFNDIVTTALQAVAENCMQEAAKEAVMENEGSMDIAVAIDGSWQKRGHTSLNGVVTATSVDTGKVIDVECLSKYCQQCKMPQKKEMQHNCTANYEGTSGGMEAEGAVRIFHRSVDSRGVKYIKYLGDGDSKGYNTVVASKPYGNDTKIEKLECIGHVHKRMGTRLRKLKKDMGKKVLSDGKRIGGKNRLTDGEIDLLQNYYGNAIRSHTNDVKVMSRAVWATYFHKLSTDEHPQHGLCPQTSDSWCKYVKNKKGYKHHGLPEELMNLIKPIYQDLSHPELLKKCLHGRTQNTNESFNNMIWRRIPKTVFVGLKTLRMGVLDSVLSFNVGNIGRARVLQHLNISPGYNTLKSLRQMDMKRVKKADLAQLEMSQEARKKKRNLKRKLEEADDPDYGAGKF